MRDSAKYTDEGWWANAAVRHFLIGHWEVAGDYNPAAAVPVWPALLTMVFEFTGVSIIAARAVNVGLSAATVALLYLLIRRYGGTQTTAAVAAVVLAASPFAFAFSRLATLDTMVVFEWWRAIVGYHLTLTRERLPAARRAGVPLLGAMVLTKTTSLAAAAVHSLAALEKEPASPADGEHPGGRGPWHIFFARPTIEIRWGLPLFLQHQCSGRRRTEAHRFSPAALVSAPLFL